MDPYFLNFESENLEQENLKGPEITSLNTSIKRKAPNGDGITISFNDTAIPLIDLNGNQSENQKSERNCSLNLIRKKIRILLKRYEYFTKSPKGYF